MEGTQTAQWRSYKQFFAGMDVQDIATRATQIFDILFELDVYKAKDRQGGVLVLATDPGAPSYIAVEVGTVPNDDPTKYCRIALKKCAVMQDTVDDPVQIFASYAVRDEAQEIYGGGITLDDVLDNVGKTVYIAFSGLPEHADEALVLVLAIDMIWMEEETARDYAIESNNPYFEPLLEAVRQKLPDFA